jgi:hypothetical protein
MPFSEGFAGDDGGMQSTQEALSGLADGHSFLQACMFSIDLTSIGVLYDIMQDQHAVNLHAR